MSLRDIKDKRLNASVGYNPHQFIELYGGSTIEMYNYQPDPNTFRGEYYYNTRLNRLYKKSNLDNKAYYWKAVSEIT